LIKVLTDIIFDGEENFSPGSLSIGDPVNNIEITSGSKFKLNGDASVWDDLLQPATSGKKGPNDKPDFDYTDLVALFPQNDATEALYYNIQLPHYWKEGSTIYPHVHFLQNQNISPTFKMYYRWIQLGETPPSWNTYIMQTTVETYTSGTISQIVHGSVGVSGVGKTISSILQITLYRQDNVYSGDCKVMSFDIHIEKDSLGSSQEYVK